MVDLTHHEVQAIEARNVADVVGRQAEDRRGFGRNGVVIRLVLGQPLVGAEEERLVLAQRTTEGAAVLLPAERALRRDAAVAGAKGEGVHRLVAEVAVGRAVEAVAARLGDGVDDAADGPAVLRRAAEADDLELLDRILAVLLLDLGEAFVLVVEAVHQHRRFLGTRAADVHAGPLQRRARVLDRRRRQQRHVEKCSRLAGDALQDLPVDDAC